MSSEFTDPLALSLPVLIPLSHHEVSFTEGSKGSH